MGRIAPRTRWPQAVGELYGWVKSLVGEATVKVCGVVVAMVQGHNWVPIPSKGSRRNVGTVPALSEDRRRQRRIGSGGCLACRSGRDGAEGP
jgi:hypothetical protein